MAGMGLGAEDPTMDRMDMLVYLPLMEFVDQDRRELLKASRQDKITTNLNML